MVKEDGHYDLCSVFLEELLINLKKIKQDKKHVLRLRKDLTILEIKTIRMYYGLSTKLSRIK